MTPENFLAKWLPTLPARQREAFCSDITTVVVHEHARERRRLTTDQSLYRKAVAETAMEISPI